MVAHGLRAAWHPPPVERAEPPITPIARAGISAPIRPVVAPSRPVENDAELAGRPRIGISARQLATWHDGADSISRNARACAARARFLSRIFRMRSATKRDRAWSKSPAYSARFLR